MNSTVATDPTIFVGGLLAGDSAKGAVKRSGKRALASAGSGLNRLFGSRARGRVGILMYHRVVDPVPGVTPPTWNVTPSALRAQLAGLIARGFRPLALRQLIECHRRGTAPPPNAFAVTFDDGHASVHDNAWPILKELGVPATLFLPTAYLDWRESFPFDSWSAAGSSAAPRETWQPMTIDQCREVTAGGLVELGAHTHTHQDFTARPKDFAHDLHENVEQLAACFGVEHALLAFPFGRATPAMMEIAQASGLACGLVTADLMVDTKQPPFGWGRFHVESWDTDGTLAAKLGGWYSWAPNLRRWISSVREAA